MHIILYYMHIILYHMHIILYHMHIIFLNPQYASQCTPLSAPLSVHPSQCTPLLSLSMHRMRQASSAHRMHRARTGHAQGMDYAQGTLQLHIAC
jgi:hypothetical protein